MKNLRKTSILFVLIISSILLSCKTTSTPSSPVLDINPGEEISTATDLMDNSRESINESSEQIDEALAEILKSAGSIRQGTPPDLESFIFPKIGNIEKQSGTIKEQNKQIRSMTFQLSEARTKMLIAADKITQIKDQVDRIAKERDQIAKERDAAIAAQKDATQKVLKWLIVACVIGGGVSIALMVFGNMAVGSMLLAGCIGTLVLAIAVEQYLEWIAIGGLVVIGIAALYAVYEIYRRQKALKEVVETAEVAKRKLPPEEREKLFGYRESPGMAMSIQSKPTEKLVQGIRKQLKKNWDHVIDDEDSKSMDKHIREERERKERINRIN